MALSETLIGVGAALTGAAAVISSARSARSSHKLRKTVGEVEPDEPTLLEIVQSIERFAKYQQQRNHDVLGAVGAIKPAVDLLIERLQRESAQLDAIERLQREANRRNDRKGHSRRDD